MTKRTRAVLEESSGNLPPTVRTDKVETAVHSVVDNVPSVQTALVLQISFVLVGNVLDYSLFTVIVGSCNYGTLHAEL